MAENNKIGAHLTFSPIPKPSDDEVMSAAKQDAQLGFDGGSENLPPKLQQIKIGLIAYKTEIWNQAQNYFTKCQTNITNAEVEHNIDQISTDLANKTLHSNELNLPKVKSSLSANFHAFETQRENYYSFKTLHGRTLLPKNADPKETRVQFYFLIGLFLIEAVLNIVMLFGGGAVTLWEAISIAIAQTTFNIISCYLLGKLIIGHIYYSKTLVQKFSLVTFFVAHIYSIIIINANMGLFRYAIAKAADAEIGDKVELINQFAFYPWDKMANLDITAGLVIAVGLVLAALAYIDGLKSDELYPGYGQAYRGPLKWKTQVDEQIKELNDRWNMCLNRFHSSQEKISQVAAESIKNWSLNTNSIEQVWSDYKKHINELEEVFDGVLNLYASKYNQYNKEKNIELKHKLLDKDEFDLKQQFDDVAQLHLDDETRIAREAEKNKQFAKDFKQIKKDLASENKRISAEIDALSKKYKCQLS